jgi:hypothetical protein
LPKRDLHSIQRGREREEGERERTETDESTSPCTNPHPPPQHHSSSCYAAYKEVSPVSSASCDGIVPVS